MARDGPRGANVSNDLPLIHWPLPEERVNEGRKAKTKRGLQATGRSQSCVQCHDVSELTQKLNVVRNETDTTRPTVLADRRRQPIVGASRSWPGHGRGMAGAWPGHGRGTAGA